MQKINEKGILKRLRVDGENNIVLDMSDKHETNALHRAAERGFTKRVVELDLANKDLIAERDKK